MFAELCEQFRLFRRIADDVQSEILLPRRKGCCHPVHLASVRVFVFAIAETNYRRAPHFRLVAGDPLEHIEQPKGVRPPFVVFDGVKKIIHTRLGLPRFQFCFGHNAVIIFEPQNRASALVVDRSWSEADRRLKLSPKNLISRLCFRDIVREFQD